MMSSLALKLFSPLYVNLSLQKKFYARVILRKTLGVSGVVKREVSWED